ncbi:MAG: hypothetical protein VW835_14025 [Rickettsiales bacterium]
MAIRPIELPEISAAEANGETRTIYREIEAALGVRLVNLVYRHLATFPGALEWAWGTVGEAFGRGEIAVAAQEVTRRLTDAAPSTPPVSFKAANLGISDAAAVRATLQAYNRANPMNAVSIRIVSLALTAGRPADRIKVARCDLPDLPDLLPIPPMEQMSDELRDILSVLARQATGGRSPVVPSLFRHFTGYPRLLQSISDWLGPIAAEGEIDALSDEIAAAADMAAARVFHDLPAHGADAFLPDEETRAALAETIRIFPPAICRMIVLGGMLSAALRD